MNYPSDVHVQDLILLLWDHKFYYYSNNSYSFTQISELFSYTVHVHVKYFLDKKILNGIYIIYYRPPPPEIGLIKYMYDIDAMSYNVWCKTKVELTSNLNIIRIVKKVTIQCP